jgi:glycosyltransferase involved in cell wall biosynthesis
MSDIIISNTVMSDVIMNDLVSICIPTYNQQDFIEATLESCVNQTYRPLEIIVLDDKSLDETFQKTHAYALNLKNHSLTETQITVRIEQNTQRRGLGGNWNTVANMAQGIYLKLLCGDDLIDPNCIFDQVKALSENANLTLICCQRRIINSQGEVLMIPIVNALENPTSLNDGLDKTWRAGTNLLGEPLCGLFRKTDFLKTQGYDGSLPYMIDLSLWIQLWKLGKVMRTPQVLGSFRVHTNSLTSQLKIKHFFEFLQFMRKSPQVVPLTTFLIGAFNAFLKTIARNLFIAWVFAKNKRGHNEPTK